MELLDLDRPDLKDPPFVAARARRVCGAGKTSSPPSARRYAAAPPVRLVQPGGRVHPHRRARPAACWRSSRRSIASGSNSPIVEALLEAGERGKQVAVLVELKARFDEENNIEWARALEHAGVHVVYGLLGLKTHCQGRAGRAARGRRHPPLRPPGHRQLQRRHRAHLHRLRPAHLPPGDRRRRSELFNYADRLFARRRTTASCWWRRARCAAGCWQRIEREIERTSRQRRRAPDLQDERAGRSGISSQALYRASQAGVRVDLIVRGMCCLRPGVPGVSENIRVISLVGRFLEHSRIYYFANGGRRRGGAHGQRRPDAAQPRPPRRDALPAGGSLAARAPARLVLPAYLRDTANASLLLPDGTYERLRPPKGEPAFDVQAWFAHEALRVPDPEAPFILQSTSRAPAGTPSPA